MVTKILPFMANYERELQIRADIRKKKSVEKITEFAKGIIKV